MRSRLAELNVRSLNVILDQKILSEQLFKARTRIKNFHISFIVKIIMINMEEGFSSFESESSPH